MLTLERDLGDFALTAYRYDGNRLLSGWAFNKTQYFTGIGDRFWRNGIGAGWRRANTEVQRRLSNRPRQLRRCVR